MADLVDYALTTVDDVKELLGLGSGDHSKDNLIKRKINFATEVIEGYTGRRFKSTTYTNEEYDATHTDQIVLRQRPVTNLANVDVRNTSFNQSDWTTVDSEDYFLDSNAGVVSSLFNYLGSYNMVRVTYTAGYTTIPSDVAEAAATLAAYLVDNPTTGTAVKRKTEGQRSIEYYDMQQNSSSLVEQLGLDDILSRYINYPLSTA